MPGRDGGVSTPVPLTALFLDRLFPTMRYSRISSTLLLGGLLVTCGCGQSADAVGPPILPLPPPPGCANTGAEVCYHVATTGDDANPGTAAAPFRTIQHAADIVNAGDGVLVVIGNHVHAIGRACTSGTGGIVGIDAYASGLVIAGNLIHDVGRFADGENGCTQPNLNWQNHDHGIYNGIGTSVVIVNNVFYNLTHGWGIQRYDGGSAVVHGLYILNNTFVGANPNRDAQIVIATATDHLVIANNIFYQGSNAGVLFDGAGSGSTLTGNVSTNALQIGGSGLVTSGNLQNTDPMFVSAGTQDFHLTGGSPALGAGITAWCPPIDYDGVARTGACSA